MDESIGETVQWVGEGAGVSERGGEKISKLNMFVVSS